jgi:hypothetical protein
VSFWDKIPKQITKKFQVFFKIRKPAVAAQTTTGSLGENMKKLFFGYVHGRTYQPQHLNYASEVFLLVPFNPG